MKKVIALILTLLPLTLLAQEWRCDEHDWLAQNVPSDTELQELNRKKRNADGTRGAAVPKRKTVPKPKPVDIELVVDSAMILADNYAEAVVNKPEMVKSRMNAVKRFYAPYAAQKPVADSICGSIYNVYVDNIERDNVVRANAFKDCFLAIADKDNENLGPLYATELAVAQEKVDTIAMKSYLSLLKEYAQLNGFDYDAEISKAQAYITSIRTRRPIAQAIAGVWVSEDIAGIDNIEDPWWDEWFDLYYGQVILQIRDASNMIYDGLKNKYYRSLKPDSITGLSIIRYDGKRENSLGSNKFNGIIEKWENPAHNIDTYDSILDTPSPTKRWFNDRFEDKSANYIQTDESAYSLYAFWGDEKLKRNNAEIGAILRQTTQQVQAQVAGELSRSKYSSGEKLAGNLTAGAVGIGVNALVDAIMVSTDRIQSLEITLHMINPYCLEAEILAQKIVSKSNSTTVTPYTVNRKIKYYRWEPDDNINFVGTHLDNCSKDWLSGLAGMYFLYNLPNKDLKEEDNKKKQYEKEYHEWVVTKEKEYKSQLKKLKKGTEEYKQLKQEFEMFDRRTTGPVAWKKWNVESLAKLKAKADNYIPNHLNTSL